MADKSNILSDIAALARAGYKVSEVKELLQLSKQPEAAPEAAAPNPEKDQAQPEPKNDDKPDAKKTEKDKPAEPEPDAKDAKDANEEKIKELQEQIKKLQEQNASRDNSGSKPDTEKQLQDLVASFM